MSDNAPGPMREWSIEVTPAKLEVTVFATNEDDAESLAMLEFEKGALDAIYDGTWFTDDMGEVEDDDPALTPSAGGEGDA